ncbi:M23 family metallopeptidase [Euzebya tangerina]|uniref:M23 family metallopeptidase n=1 Tax=Euzebya tangerina TaxID=591198 RepID=UPI0013C2A1F3|nr:M23 family metallopeptidase [Euzebya tangerina]
MAVLASSTSAASAQTQSDLEELENRIDEAEDESSGIQDEIEGTVAQLDVIVAAQRETQATLNELESELGEAEADLEDRERVLAATQAQLDQTAARLETTETELQTAETEFGESVRQEYMSTAPTGVTALLSVRRAADVSVASSYLERITQDQLSGAEQLEVLRATLAADRDERARLRSLREGQRAAAAAERDNVASLVRQQAELVAAQQAQAEEKQGVLAALQRDRESATALVAELEQESDELRQELAEIAARQEAERVAAAEAAAAAAESAEETDAAAAASTSSFTGDDDSAASTSAARPSDGDSDPTDPPVDDDAAAGEAGTSTAEPDVAQAAPVDQTVSSGGFSIPVAGRVSSEFGYRIHPISGVSKLHAGMDIAAPGGTPIGAAGAGTVIFAGWRGGYGNAVIIDHGGGITTLYAHQSQLASSTGDVVSQGQVIGYVGTTGYSTGNHLHWEVRDAGSPVDPRSHM